MSSSNPYKTFLDNIGDKDYYRITMALDTWLEALGPMTMPRSLCGKEKSKPWSPQVRDDLVDISTRETVNKIAKSFSSWLKKLPGSEPELRNWKENDIKKMFDIFNKAHKRDKNKSKGREIQTNFSNER